VIADNSDDAVALAPRLPAISYSFARKHGVVLRLDGDRPVASLREGADPAILIEVKRHLDGAEKAKGTTNRVRRGTSRRKATRHVRPSNISG
jgi:hypothetical protein